MKGCYRECLAHGIDETHEGTSNVDSTTSCASTIHLRKGRDTNCDMREKEHAGNHGNHLGLQDNLQQLRQDDWCHVRHLLVRDIMAKFWNKSAHSVTQ